MQKAVAILLKRYNELWWEIFASYLIKIKWDDESKKSQDAMRFMEWLMNGDFKKEWNLEDMEQYKEMREITLAINILSDTK